MLSISCVVRRAAQPCEEETMRDAVAYHIHSVLLELMWIVIIAKNVDP